MKYLLLLPLLATAGLSVATATAKSCLRTYSSIYVNSATIKKTELLKAIQENKNIEGFYQASSGNRIYIKFEAGDTSKPLVFDSHGLGDSHTDMNALNKLINKEGAGYRTLRVDTHLNGKTLDNFLAENNLQIPPYFHYKHNTYDIAEIILDTGAKDILMMGHSYGGGLVWDLTTYINKKINYDLILKLKHNRKGTSPTILAEQEKIREELLAKLNPIKGVVQMSPYLQRADKYQAEKITNMTVVPETITSIVATLSSFGFPEGLLEGISKPWVDLSLGQVDAIRKSLIFPQQVMEFTLSKRTQDMMMDPFMDQFMEKNFTTYFVYKAKLALQKTELSESDMKLIALKVKACISLTKGIRTFDILDREKLLQWPKGVPVLLIGGEKDVLVNPLQLQDFTKRLEDAGIQYSFFVIQDGTHLFPQTHADKVAVLIEQFFNEILKEKQKP